MSEKLKELSEKIKKKISILIESNEITSAKKALKEYEKLVNNDVDIYSIKGTILIIENKIDEAIDVLKKGMYIYGENFDILFNLGYIFENKNKIDEAVKYYKRAIINSNNKDITNMVYDILRNLGVNESINEIVESFNDKNNRKKIKVTFFPYKISMWDSLKSIYDEAIRDENCIVNVVPIPYYELSNDDIIEKYEGDKFCQDVLITHHSKYNIEYEKPDIVFMHNIYDECNTITRVYDKYFTYNIKKYVEMLVYVPYHIPSLFYPFGKHATYTMPAVKHVDKIVIMNDYLKKLAISDNIPESKLMSLGSPKIDFLINNISKDKIYIDEWKDVLKDKTVYLLETGCLYFINDTFSKIEELINILNIPNINDKTAIIWRPHPLTKAALRKYSIDLFHFYDDLTKNKIKGKNKLYNNIILDETDNYINAINASDVLISDNSSLLGAYLLTEKKIIFLGKELPKDSLVEKNTFYYFYNKNEPWYELIKKINNGYDPLLNNRKGVAKKIYKNLDGTCGENIYNTIKKLVLNNK